MQVQFKVLFVAREGISDVGELENDLRVTAVIEANSFTSTLVAREPTESLGDKVASSNSDIHLGPNTVLSSDFLNMSIFAPNGGSLDGDAIDTGIIICIGVASILDLKARDICSMNGADGFSFALIFHLVVTTLGPVVNRKINVPVNYGPPVQFVTIN